MPLLPGTRLGAYDIVSLIGAGGMGEVYRATDSRLKRDVAVKVLPVAFAADAERLARFQREAEMLAALNHPNIAAIYGLEETSGGHALVIELVDGPTLADLIAQHRTGMPVSEALPIARQILDALEAAHEHGIIHRDLKPANIKVREDGAVKVLDFGLAKALDVKPSGALANSPTITSPAVTAAGIILGTAAYMSPEQARGRFVDKRTDIWAFGAVVYEMLTGKRAFDGEDVSMTLAAVMKAEPDWTAVPSEVPPPVRTCLTRCLQKDPKQRIRDVGDVRLLIEGAFSAFGDDHSPPRRWPAWAPGAAVAALVGALWLGVAGNGSIARAPDARQVMRFEHVLPGKLEFRGGNRTQIAGSPDGTRFVYNAMDGLYLRTLSDGTDRRVVTGSLATSNPTFSPDSRSLAYFDSGHIKRLALTGGAPVVVAATFNPYAINWARDNAIYFASPDGISRVPVDGGDPQVVIAGATGEQLSGPQLLPDGETVLFTVYRS
ncbi:MAG TPA: protein kinase, partial [Vicinamibacterales bacterium]